MGTSGTPLQYVMSIVWMRSFIEPDLSDNNTVRQYHSDLSDQSALEIRDRISVSLLDLELHYFTIFHGE